MHNNGGYILRRAREEQGLTQDRLAEGVCSRETVSNIELGKSNPRVYILRSLFGKLGLNVDDYYTLPRSKEDLYMDKKILDLHELVTAHDYEKIKKFLELIKIDKDIDEEARALMINKCKAKLYSQGPYQKLKRAEKHIMTQLKANRKPFNLSRVHTYSLTKDELWFLQTLVSVYNETDRVDKSIKILEQLRQYYIYQNARSVKIHNRISVEFYNITHNLNASYDKNKNWTKSLELSYENLELAKKYFDTLLHYRSLYYKANALMYLGRRQEGIETFKRFFAFNYATEDSIKTTFDERGIIKKVEEDHNISLVNLEVFDNKK